MVQSVPTDRGFGNIPAPARRRRMRWLLAVLLVGLAACTGESGPAATRTAAGEATEGASATASPSTAATTPSVLTDAASEVDAVGMEPGTLVVSGGRGVDLVAVDGSVTAVTSLPAVRAFPDGAGGVVLQGMSPPGESPPSPALIHLPAGADEGVTVLPDGWAPEVRLLDAGLVSGVPHAVFAATPDVRAAPDGADETDVPDGVDGADPPGTGDGLFVLPLDGVSEPDELSMVDAGSRTGQASRTVQASLGAGDVLAYQRSPSAESGFGRVRVTDAPVDVVPMPLPASTSCPAGSPGAEPAGCPSLPTLSPARADLLAWVEGTARGAPQLVLGTRDGSGEPTRLSLPAQEEGVVLDAMDIGGGRAVVSRSRAGQQGFSTLPPLIVDLDGGAVTEGEVEGFTAVAG